MSNKLFEICIFQRFTRGLSKKQKSDAAPENIPTVPIFGVAHFLAKARARLAITIPILRNLHQLPPPECLCSLSSNSCGVGRAGDYVSRAISVSPHSTSAAESSRSIPRTSTTSLMPTLHRPPHLDPLLGIVKAYLPRKKDRSEWNRPSWWGLHRQWIATGWFREGGWRVRRGYCHSVTAAIGHSAKSYRLSSA